MKKIHKFRRINLILCLSAALLGEFVSTASAQIPRLSPTPNAESGDDFTWWYITLGALVLGLGGAVVWWLKGKKAAQEKAVQEQQKAKKKENSWDANSLDADKEMEWLRKNQNLVDKKRKKATAKKKMTLESAQAANNNDVLEAAKEKEAVNPNGLPVFSFESAKPAKPISQLPLSSDEALLSAIEQTHEEEEEDEEVRDLAVRILTAFKTRNSVEALSQVGLYDLSASLRSKAILTLTEFDHESVFETILLACADPSREVRAAAARGLTRLSFDRADSWARIAETNETGRIRQAARAAIESGFVERSFERLVHRDQHYSYEAFVLLSLLIKAGETAPIFNALKNHKDNNVKLAILHLLKVTKDENALEGLYSLLEETSLPPEIRSEVDIVINEIGFVTV